jgi:UDP-3-O-[3-hydroxymyristoyl] N-acetylglucosamine deacetylase / 3-hydroxyacyl-[acyl-carrier-protein] dehydratase
LKRNQRTLAGEAALSGVGLHTGVETTLSLRPAEAGTGIRFVLETDDGPAGIPYAGTTVSTGLHRTVVSEGGASVETVEHLCAALYGMGIDNAEARLSAPEPPGADGSSKPFVDLIRQAGIAEQEAPAEPFVLKEPFAVHDGEGGIIAAAPHRGGLRVSCVLDFAESTLAQGRVELDLTPEAFAGEIAPARTFCLEKHAQAMREAGCGKGASTENTLVLREDSIIDNELRFPDECARHKVLDLVGDLSVVGRPLHLQISALRSSHKLNALFAAELLRRIERQENPKGLLDIRQIEATLPHRYPFLLVDRVLEIVEGKRISALKNVTRNEEFFEGHFPGQPVMPGVLQIEALAQTAGIMMLRQPTVDEDALAVLMAIDDVKYRRPVVPGDQLLMSAEMERVKGRLGTVRARARVDGDVVTEARIKFALVDSNSYT